MALLPVDEARQRILKGVKPLTSEVVSLDKALGRVLAETTTARRAMPPFDASAMDGYAVRHEDMHTLPATFQIIGTSAAGHAFKGRIKPGTCVRILTGAPVPSGADTVVIQENTIREGDLLLVQNPTAPGKNIRRWGLDVKPGELIVAKGKTLVPRDIGLLAAANKPVVKVYRKPRVVVFTTGDELVLPGNAARADQIYSSNSHALAAMVAKLGAEVVNLGIVPDTLKATITAVKKGLGADVLITTGGASVGDHDYVQAAFKASGVAMDFWKIAMRPGKPFMYGRKGKTHVMGLPGNPVSALVTARLFLQPLLDAFSGGNGAADVTTAQLQGALPGNDDRQDYIRATLSVAPNGARTVTPFGTQDSSMQRVMQSAQALIIRPPHASAATDGEAVPVVLLDF